MDGCRYARAGHSARAHFALMDLKFTEYTENVMSLKASRMPRESRAAPQKVSPPHTARDDAVAAPRALAVFRRRP